MSEAELDWSQYEAIVEKRWAYYRPRFERFAQGGWISWNWAAFFATLAWLRYRRLYAWSWIYFFVSMPFLLGIVMAAAAGVDPCERALSAQSHDLFRIAILSLIGLGWIVPPLIANRIYFVRVRALVGGTGKYHGTGGYAGALFLQLCVLLVPAVTLPSYGNYLYRAMVSEGESMAAAAEKPVAEYVNDHAGKLPDRLEDQEALVDCVHADSRPEAAGAESLAAH